MTIRDLRPIALAVLLTLGTAAAQNDFPRGFVGAVEATPAAGAVGESVTISGDGFPADADLELVWGSYDLEWDLGETEDGAYDGTFRGLTRTDTERPLASVSTDADGTFAYTFELPEDFGGPHNVLVREAGDNVNRVGVEIVPDMRIDPAEGPLGSDVTVTVTGLHSGQPMVWYQLTYDHGVTGFLSAVTTRGTARAVIPATGRVGRHLIRLEDSPFGQPYLALDTSPWDFLEVPSQTFTVTDGEPVLPPPVTEQALPATRGSEPAGEEGPRMWSDPVSAPVGSFAVLHGKGFEPGATVELELSGMEGSRVTDSGFAPISTPFGTVSVDDDGTFSLRYAFPDTHGGDHWIRAVGGSDEAPAAAPIKILPIAFPLDGQQVTFGEEMRFHLKGIGWTQTENIFGIVVDNVYIGYACGFSTNGDVDFPLEASFAPGWHVVDVYPSFYRNNAYSEVDETPFLFRHALLSWQDHPSGFHFRFAFEVVEEDAVEAVADR